MSSDPSFALTPMPIDEVRLLADYAKRRPSYEKAWPIIDYLNERFRGIYDPEAFEVIDSITKHFKDDNERLLKAQMQSYIERLARSGEIPHDNATGKVRKRIFHDNLDENKIAPALMKINREDYGEKQFCYVVKDYFTSIGWLTNHKDTDFVTWMKTNGIVSMIAKGLTHVTIDAEKADALSSDLRNVFQITNKTGKWVDRKEFYFPDRIIINSGK